MRQNKKLKAETQKPRFTKLVASRHLLLATNSGFSLVELMVIITIIGIIMLIAIPNFAAMQRQARIEGAVQGLAQDLRVARERALSRGFRYQVLFNTINKTEYVVTFTDHNGVVHSRTQRLGGTTGGNLYFGHKGATGNPPEGNGPVPPDGVDFPGDILIIDSRGGATRGVVYVTDNQRNYALGINSLGRVRVYQFRNNGWH